MTTGASGITGTSSATAPSAPPSSTADLYATVQSIATIGVMKGWSKAQVVAKIVAYVMARDPKVSKATASSLAGAAYDRAAGTGVANPGNLAGDFATGVSDAVGSGFSGITGTILRVGVGMIGLSLLVLGLIMLAKQETLKGAVGALKKAA